jgi:hypothetical protein
LLRSHDVGTTTRVGLPAGSFRDHAGVRRRWWVGLDMSISMTPDKGRQDDNVVRRNELVDVATVEIRHGIRTR